MTASRSRRTKLIAHFHDSFAEGWHFAVHEAFRSALDIQLVDRTKTVKKSDGAKHRTVRRIWTQGSDYAFQPGDIFHEVPRAQCRPWAECLAFGGYTLQIRDAAPAGHDPSCEGDYNPGRVWVDVFQSKDDKLVRVGNFTSSQVAFVQLLKTGLLEGKSMQDAIVSSPG